MTTAEGVVEQAGNDRRWQRAWRYITGNQLAPAQAMLEAILASTPGDTRARVYLAAVHAAADRPRAACAAVRLAAGTQCVDPDTLLRLARIATRVGEVGVARTVLAGTPLAGSTDPARLLEVAEAWQVLGEHPSALASIDRAARAGVGGPRLHFQRGVELGALGQLAAAKREFTSCTRSDPPLGYAFLQLARLRHPSRADNEAPAIRRALGRVEAGGDDHIALQFALYHELEGLARHAEAWGALALGNRLARARSPFDAAYEAAMFGRLRALTTPEFLDADGVGVGDGPQPIFVIGMPRSGTTVLERILGNHSAVESAGELGAFLRALSFAVDHFVPVACPDEGTLARLGEVDWALVRDHYLAQSQWRARGKRCYVDKLPRNWMLAGLIYRAFPRAPILNLVREPLDVCFSNWRAHLGVGPDFAYAYDVDAIVAHYAQYRRLLHHWHRTMPGAILDVDYARLVREPEAVAREVFAFCRLAYEPGCTDLARNPSPTATLSMAEVREPIHDRASRAWEPYAERLAGMRAALARAIGEAAV